jgi:hypothetical protein
MVFRHTAKGSGEVITTMNPIYDYSTGNGGPKPPMTDKWPADKWTAKLPVPKGERDRYSGVTPAKDSPSGAHFVGEAGLSATGSTNAPKSGFPLDQGIKRGIPIQDAFNRGVSRIGGGARQSTSKFGAAKNDKGTPYKSSRTGKTEYMGRSGISSLT